jgi:hypothetical protein
VGANIVDSGGYFNCTRTCPGYEISAVPVIDSSRNIVNANNGTFGATVTTLDAVVTGTAYNALQVTGGITAASLGISGTASNALQVAGGITASTLQLNAINFALNIPNGSLQAFGGTFNGALSGNTVNAVNGLSINGTTILDASQDLTITGPASFASVTTTGGISVGANIVDSGGYFNCTRTCPGYEISAVPVIDSSRNIVNAASGTFSGNLVTTSGVIRGSSTGGGFQIDNTTVIDDSRNFYGTAGTFSGFVSAALVLAGASGFSSTSPASNALNLPNGGAYIGGSLQLIGNIVTGGVSSSNSISTSNASAIFVQNGNRGVTATITTGSCTLTISGGIVTGHSGC